MSEKGRRKKGSAVMRARSKRGREREEELAMGMRWSGRPPGSSRVRMFWLLLVLRVGSEVKERVEVVEGERR